MNTMNNAAAVESNEQEDASDVVATEVVNQVTEAITPNDVTTVQVVEGVTQHVIAVPNPGKAEMEELLASVKDKHNYDVTTKVTQFNFKKNKDKDTGIETIRNSVQLAMAYPSFPDGLIAILETGKDSKQTELLMEAVEKIVNDAAREILYEDVTLNAATFPYDKISWDEISKQPKAQRRGGGIPKETWEGFAQDYIDVMPAITGKSIEQVGYAAKLMSNKLSQCKTNEPVLKLLVSQLAIYTESSPNIEDYAECVEFLLGKANTFLNLSDADLLANL